MQQRDYFQKQVDALGKVLTRLLSDVMGLKEKGSSESIMEISNQTLKSELDLEINDILAIATEECIDFLQTKKNISYDNLERIADLVIFNIENTKNDFNQTDHINLYKKCLSMYVHVQKNDSTFSFARDNKIQKISDIIAKREH